MSRGAFVVILEGPDGAGKTTLAELIKDSNDHVEIVHNGPPEPGADLYRLYKDQIRLALRWRKAGHSTVIDRSFLSELMYGVFRAGGPRLTLHQVKKLELFCVLHRVLLVSVEEDANVRKARVTSRGERWIPEYVWTGHAYHRHFTDKRSVWHPAGEMFTSV